MESEKVKKIKKVLEQNTKTCLLYDFEKNTECKVFQCKDILDYINELESELEKEQINNLNCDTELQYKDKRINELESENEKLKQLYGKGYFIMNSRCSGKSFGITLFKDGYKKAIELFAKELLSIYAEIPEEVELTIKDFKKDINDVVKALLKERIHE